MAPISLARQRRFVPKRDRGHGHVCHCGRGSCGGSLQTLSSKPLLVACVVMMGVSEHKKLRSYVELAQICEGQSAQTELASIL